MSNEHREYAAFISYRNTPKDRRWAIWLHRGLERWRTPRALVKGKSIRRRVGKVFRDEEESTAQADLSRAIREALEESQHLIVVCSPRSKASEWVNDEVVYFGRELERADQVLSLLIEGEPDESFPPALRQLAPLTFDQVKHGYQQINRPQPLAADVREHNEYSPRECKRRAKLMLLARLLDCKYDDLVRREERRRRWRVILVGALAALLFAAALATVLFVRFERQKANTAAKTRDRATFFRTLRTAEEAHAQGNRVRLAELLKNCDTKYRGFAWRRLNERLQRTRLLNAEHSQIQRVAVDPAGEVVIAQGAGKRSDVEPPFQTFDFVAWNDRGKVLYRRAGPSSPSRSFRFSVDGFRFCAASNEELRVWNARTGADIAVIGSSDSRMKRIAVAKLADRAVTLSTGRNAELSSWNLKSGEMLATRQLSSTHELYVSGDGQRAVVAVGSDRSAVDLEVYNVANLNLETRIAGVGPIWLLRLSPALDEVVILDDGYPIVRQLISGARLPLAAEKWKLGYAVFSDDASTLAAVLSRPSNGGNPKSHAELRVWSRPWQTSGTLIARSATGFEHVELGRDGRIALVEFRSGMTLDPETRKYVQQRGSVRLFNTNTGREIISLAADEDTGWRIPVALTSDGRSALSMTAARRIALWDLVSGSARTTWLGLGLGRDTWPTAVAVSESGTLGAIGAQNGYLWIASLMGAEEHGARSLHAPGATVTALTFSRDGRHLIAGGFAQKDGTGPGSTRVYIKRWNVQTWEVEGSFPVHRHSVTALALHPTDPLVVACNGFDAIGVWDLESGNLVHSLHTLKKYGEPANVPDTPAHGGFEPYSHGYQDLSWSPDGRWIAASGLQDGAVRFWQHDNAIEVHAMRPIERGAMALAFSPDGRHIVIGSLDERLRVYNVPRFDLAWEISLPHQASASRIAFGPEAKFIAVGTLDGRLIVVDVKDRALEHDLPAHLQAVTAVSFSPAPNSLVATASFDGIVRVFDPVSGAEAIALRGEQPQVHAIAFDPEGNFLASGGLAGTVKIWQAAR